jgi:hypothetical protein
VTVINRIRMTKIISIVKIKKKMMKGKVEYGALK